MYCYLLSSVNDLTGINLKEERSKFRGRGKTPQRYLSPCHSKTTFFPRRVFQRHFDE